MSRRLLMLALDSIDWFLVNEWAAEGHLPVLRRLLEDSRQLLCTESNRALPGSVWTDIATGVSAGTHGYVDLTHLTPNSYGSDRIDASRLSALPFYKVLSDAGIRCAIVDFPIDYLLPDFNGVQIVDWGTEFKLGKFGVSTPGLAAELDSHPLTHYDRTALGLSDLLALKHKLMRGIEVKRRFAVSVLQKREHDFVFYNFAELHKAGHFFWKFHDHKHPDFTDSEPQLRHALREVYAEMDRAIGNVLEQLGSDDNLVLVTDRGMYADYRGDHLIEKVLLQLNLAAPRGPSQESRAETWRTRLLNQRETRKALRFVGQKLLPESVRQALLPFHRAAVGEAAPLDWRKTRVYAMPAVGNSHLRVNLAGREPLGIVTSGAEFQAVLAEATAQLRALINPATGERAVEEIYFPSTRFQGPRAAELPDMAIVWNPNSPITALTSPAMGTVSGKSTEGRTGNHRPDGFALFSGPSFSARGQSMTGDPRQIAPTILRHFGITPPAYYEKTAISLEGEDRSRAA